MNKSVNVIIYICIFIVCVCIVISIAKEIKEQKKIKHISSIYQELTDKRNQKLFEIAKMKELNESQYRLGLSTDEEYVEQGKKMVSLIKEANQTYKEEVESLMLELDSKHKKVANLNETKKDE